MAFDDLPARPAPIFAAARIYADQVLQRSREVAHGGAVRFTGDVPFGPDYYQKLDVYAPPAQDGPLPVLLFLHGGAFIGGYKEWMGFMAPAILAIPAIFVSVSYRLAPEHPFPAAVEDTAAAVDWAWHNIARFGGDRERLFVGGHSAGGNLAAVVALDPRWLARHRLPAGVIKGVLPVSAPLDLRYAEWDPSNEPALTMQRTYVKDDADVALASPMHLAAVGAPPFFLSVGDRDLWRLAEEMDRFRARLDELGVPAATALFADHDHFDTNTRCIEPDHAWIDAARAFIAAPPAGQGG